MAAKKSQEKRIREYLEAGGTLTALGALHLFDCFRLAARVKDLRDAGVEIATTTRTLGNGKTIYQYRLAVKS